jgi:hypothetical protein
MTARIFKHLSDLLVKIFALSTVKSVFEKAYTICTTGGKQRDSQVNVALGSFYVRQTIDELSKPLGWKGAKKGTRKLLQDINKLTKEIHTLYEAFQSKWCGDVIAECLNLCNGLENTLAKITSEALTYGQA